MSNNHFIDDYTIDGAIEENGIAEIYHHLDDPLERA